MTNVTELTVTNGANVTLASWGGLKAYKLGRIVIVTGYGVKFTAASGQVCTIAGIRVSKYIASVGTSEGSSEKSFIMTASPSTTNRIDYDGVANLNANTYFQFVLFVDE